MTGVDIKRLRNHNFSFLFSVGIFELIFWRNFCGVVNMDGMGVGKNYLPPKNNFFIF
nr:hypothetical protein [Lysinibacillus sp. S2017]